MFVTDSFYRQKQLDCGVRKLLSNIECLCMTQRGPLAALNHEGVIPSQISIGAFNELLKAVQRLYAFAKPIAPLCRSAPNKSLPTLPVACIGGIPKGNLDLFGVM